MGTRKIVTAWAAVLIATAGVGTGIAVMADDPKPKSDTSPVAAAPSQPDKPPPAPKPTETEKEQAEEDRRKALARTIDQLQAERDRLAAQAEELQQLLIRRQREELNPQLAQAMGAVLTEAELTIFRTELEVRSAEQRIDDHRKRLKEAEAKPLNVIEIAEVATPEREHLETLEQKRRQQVSKLAELSAITKEDAPAVREQVAKLAQLDQEIRYANAKAQKAAEKAIRDGLVSPIQRQLSQAEVDLRSNQRTLEAARKRRDEIVATLAKADDHKQSVETQRLTTQLQVNRERDQQLSRILMMLELEQKGLPTHEATRPAASDDRLDRVLRELTELRAEVRRLREKK
jgi:hypothetical protein